MSLIKKEHGGRVPKNRLIDGFRPNNPLIGQPVRGIGQRNLSDFSDSGDSPQQKANLESVFEVPNATETKIDKPEQPQKDRKRRIRKVLKIGGMLFATLLVLGVLTGGYLFVKGWIASKKIFKGGGSSSTLYSTDIAPEKLKGEGDGRINILLLGNSGGDHPGADLTDSIVVASIDPVAKDIALLSIPRDLWVSVPGYWSMKINAAYVSGMQSALDDGKNEADAQEAGFATLEETIQQYLGIPIHYHALVNFEAFREGVDAIGGVDVNVEEDLYDTFIMADNDNNPLIAKAGLQHFDGRHALLYAQSRHSTSDFDRGKRQRLVLIAIKEKILTIGTFSNPNTVSKLIDALGNNVSVNATLGEIMRMYEITKDIPSSSIATIGLTDETNPLVTTGNVNGQSIVQPRAGLTDFSDIQSFVRNALRDPFLKSENASIAVLNGSGVDNLATQKANELKSYGYNVTIIDSAPTSDYQKTLIFDNTNGAKKFTKNYLEKRLGATVSTDPIPEGIVAQADFVVVLGADANSQNTSN